MGEGNTGVETSEGGKVPVTEITWFSVVSPKRSKCVIVCKRVTFTRMAFVCDVVTFVVYTSRKFRYCVMMMIVPNSRTSKEKGEHGRI